MNLAVGRTFPVGQAHVLLTVIGAIHKDFCRRLPMNGKVQLVLHRRKKALGRGR